MLISLNSKWFMLLIILLLLLQISCVKTFAKMQYTNIIKDTILNDPKMPMIYTNKYLKKSLTNTVANCNYNKQFVSAEHIYPQCLLNIKYHV